MFYVTVYNTHPPFRGEIGGKNCGLYTGKDGRLNYVMSNNDNDGELADTIYIICWGVDEPTLYAIFSKSFFVTIE